LFGETEGTRMRRSHILQAETIGEAWRQVVQLILRKGVAGDWEGQPLIEVERVTLDVATPDPEDPFIARHADVEWLTWMRKNFNDHSPVAALDGARSYASRLFDYGGAGRDQLGWAIEKLRRNPTASNATLTMLEPLTDTSYVPCVSLLDFWLRAGRLELIVYAHSIDFGKKGYGNLIELAEIQKYVTRRTHAPHGALVMFVKSAHIYENERASMRELADAAMTATP
jgi:thymidylate synthase